MRVVVLGAGASLHAGYPLAASLGKSLAAWVDTRGQEDPYQALMKHIRERYGGLEDFEVVLADLMTPPPGSPQTDLRPLQEALREYFDTIRSQPAALYDRLARLLKPGDTVISFNYDLGIERTLRSAKLWHIQTGYGFEIEGGASESPIKVLKLHGSTNWRALIFGGRRSGGSVISGGSLGDRPVLFFRPDLEYLDYTSFVDPLCAHLSLAATLAAMILPASPKQFYFQTSFGDEWVGFWERLWQLARQTIEDADDLTIIGYSMPLIDEKARDLLLNTSNLSVPLSICCGSSSESIQQEFKERGFTNIVNGAATFEEWLVVEEKKTR